MASLIDDIVRRNAETEEGTAMIALYTSIPGQAKRLAALEQLVLHLGTNEHLALIGYISERHDVAHRLPTELFQGIFNYLPLFSVWRLQMVSRQWRRVLSSTDFLLARLAHEGRLPRLPKAPGEHTPDVILRRAIRRMQAQRLGRPFYTSSFSVPLHAPIQRTHEHMMPWIALQNDVLAYVVKADGRHSEVIRRNLLTGSQQAYCDVARENISTLTLTDEVLAFATSNGVLYVTQTEATDPQLQRLRLPSAQIYNMAADGSTVAVLMAGNQARQSTLAVYSTVTESLHEYDFQNYTTTTDQTTRKLVPQALILSEKHCHINVFSSDSELVNSVGNHLLPGRYRTTISHQRFMLHPDPKGSRLEMVQSSFVEIACNAHCTIGRTSHAAEEDWYRVHLNLKPANPSEHIQPTTNEYAPDELLLMFNATVGELVVNYHILPPPLHRPMWLLGWKDATYSQYVSEYGDREGINVATMPNPDSPFLEQASQVQPLQYRGCIRWRGRFRHSYVLLGMINADFLVTVSTRGSGDYLIVVHGFDEGAPLANGHATDFWDMKCCDYHYFSHAAEPDRWTSTPKAHNISPWSLEVEAPRRPVLPYELDQPLVNDEVLDMHT